MGPAIPRHLHPPTERVPYSTGYSVYSAIGLSMPLKRGHRHSAEEFPLRQLRLHSNAAERKRQARHPAPAGPLAPGHLSHRAP